MVELFLALLVGLIGAGIVAAMLRDGARHGYPPGSRRRAERPAPFEAEPYEPEPPPALPPREAGAVRRARPAPVTAPAREREAAHGGGRGGLVLAVAALGAAAVLVVVMVARPWSGDSGATNEDPRGGAVATADGTSTAQAVTARTSTATSTATPTATPRRTSTPAPPNVATLAVQARQQASVRVTVDGRTEFEGTLGAGESRSWAGSTRVQLWTDNGKNVAVTVNGFDLGPLSTAVGHPEWNTVDWGWAAGWRP